MNRACSRGTQTQINDARLQKLFGSRPLDRYTSLNSPSFMGNPLHRLGLVLAASRQLPLPENRLQLAPTIEGYKRSSAALVVWSKNQRVHMHICAYVHTRVYARQLPSMPRALTARKDTNFAFARRHNLQPEPPGSREGSYAIWVPANSTAAARYLKSQTHRTQNHSNSNSDT